jgi:hypothetical protein
MIAAEAIEAKNMILWRYKPTNQIHTWTLNANWAWQSSSGLMDRNSTAAYGLENSFKLDLNGDSLIGPPSTPA